MLLRNGVMWKEFAALSKELYVEVAGTDYGIDDRPTNASRVSLLTGLTRREVKKQRDILSGALPEQPAKTNNAMRLLAGWHKDPAFIDEDGRPQPLSRDESDEGFGGLHRLYGGDIPAIAMLKELIATGAVAELDDGRIVAVSRYYMPDPVDPEALLRSGSVIGDLGNTVAFNLARQSAESSLFEGRATAVRIPLEKVAEYREFLEARGQTFLELVDDWLEQNQVDNDSTADGQPVARLGVGVYQIQDEISHRGDPK